MDEADQFDLLAMCRVRGVSWHFLAREAQRPEGMERLRAGRAMEDSRDATKSLAALASARDDLSERQRTVEAMLAATEADGIQLTTVLDQDYPVNLRTIYNLPRSCSSGGRCAPTTRSPWRSSEPGRRPPSA
jgi:DNA processing protein